MLRIPKEGKETAPLMAPLQKVDFAEDDQDPRAEKRTRSKRKRKKRQAEVPDWDPASGKWKINGAGRKRTLQIIATWVGALAALVVAMYLFKKAGEPVSNKRAETSLDDPGQVDNAVSVPLVLPGGDSTDQAEPPVEAK